MVSQLSLASLLVSQGYAVFIMAYFNYENLPKELYDIPLETFLSGVRWLRQQTEVDEKHIAAMAPSKGAEGILAAASYLPEMNLNALVAIAPSNVVWQGIGRGKPKPQSSWSLQGESLSYFAMNALKILPQFIARFYSRLLKLTRLFPSLERISLLPAYSDVKKNKYQNTAAKIPVEKIMAPLLLIAGVEDKMWPSSYMSRCIIEKRRAAGLDYKDELCIYPRVGHVIRFPYVPTTVPWMATSPKGMTLNFGGEAKAVADAQLDAWRQIKTFLGKHLH